MFVDDSSDRALSRPVTHGHNIVQPLDQVVVHQLHFRVRVLAAHVPNTPLAVTFGALASDLGEVGL
jgi:hypothetical protein